MYEWDHTNSYEFTNSPKLKKFTNYHETVFYQANISILATTQDTSGTSANNNSEHRSAAHTQD